MTEEQERLFVRIAIAGLTQGFENALDWLEAHDAMIAIAYPHEEQMAASQRAWEAFAAVYTQTAPYPSPLTVDELRQMVRRHDARCCFPGCYRPGVGEVVGMENTNLRLCVKHEGCVKSPPPPSPPPPPPPTLPPPGVR